MSKRVRISNERVNSYGFRVLTSGMDVAQYLRNPVLLYMHERGQVIGYMKDVEVKDGEVTGEPVFDEVTELSKRCKKQFEFGSLKMVSAGLEIYETSDDQAQLAEGQKRPTVTRSRLCEVSLVDIGSNDDAIVLKMGGQTVNLANGEECPLPLLTDGTAQMAQEGYLIPNPSSLIPKTLSNPNNNKSEMMTLKDVALMVGLPETATEAEVRDRMQLMMGEHARLEAAEKQLTELAKARVAALVERGIRERRIEAARRDEMIALFGKLGADESEKLLSSMAQQVKPSQLIQQNGAAQLAQGATPEGWKTLHDVPADQLLKLKAERADEYARLYKAEYGVDYQA